MVDAYTQSQLDYLRTTFRKLNETPRQQEKIYPHLTASSVLIPLYIKNGIIHVLLTIRSKSTLTHKGLVAFPGGVRSKEDASSIDTALREAHEEIGLSPSDVEVLYVLPMTWTVPSFSVVPVIGLIPSDFELVVDKREVDEAFSVPLFEFLNYSNCRKEVHIYYGREIITYFYKLNASSTSVWCYGLTSHLCLMVAAIVYEKSSYPKLMADQESTPTEYSDFYHFMSEQTLLKKPINFSISKQSTLAMAPSGNYTVENVKFSIMEFISGLKRHDFRFDHTRQASVLIPLMVKNGEVNLLFTKRSRKLRTHPGAVSFPGGIKDQSDKDDVDTATREAEEEIGLRRDNVEIVGILPPVYASPATSVVPVIGMIKDDFEPNLNLDEVAFVFYVPLRLFSRENSDVRVWDFYEKPLNLYYFFHKVNEKMQETIFGMTAVLSLVINQIVIKKSKTMPPMLSGGAEEVDIESELEYYYNHCGEQSKTKKLGNLNERPFSSKY